MIFLKRYLWLWGLIAVVVAVFFFLSRSHVAVISIESEAAYQAVFLTNGQVYFGKLSVSEGNYFTLRDIYYLRIIQRLQPKDINALPEDANLVKLGDEFHGPKDTMRLNRSHIVFYENLRPDSSLVKAIVGYRRLPD